MKTDDFGDLPPLLTVREAAALLRVAQRTIYRMVRQGTLRAYMVGSAIRIPSSSLGHLAAPTDCERQAKSNHVGLDRGKIVWHFGDEERHGGSISQRQVASALDARLAQLIGGPRRSGMTASAAMRGGRGCSAKSPAALGMRQRSDS